MYLYYVKICEGEADVDVGLLFKKGFCDFRYCYNKCLLSYVREYLKYIKTYCNDTYHNFPSSQPEGTLIGILRFTFTGVFRPINPINQYKVLLVYSAILSLSPPFVLFVSVYDLFFFVFIAIFRL